MHSKRSYKDDRLKGNSDTLFSELEGWHIRQFMFFYLLLIHGKWSGDYPLVLVLVDKSCTADTLKEDRGGQCCE